LPNGDWAADPNPPFALANRSLPISESVLPFPVTRLCSGQSDDAACLGVDLYLEGLVGDRRDGPVHDAKGGGRWGVFLFQGDDEVQRLRQIQDDSGGLELRGDLDVGEGGPCGTVGMRMVDDLQLEALTPHVFQGQGQ